MPRMHFRPVLIEKEDKPNCTVLASSAILIEDKYILTTCTPLNNLLRENVELLREVEEGKLHFYQGKSPITFHVLWQSDDDEAFTLKKAKLFGLFKCKNLTEFYRNDFKDCSVDFRECNINLTESVAIFLILAVEGQDIDEENLKSTLHSWLIEASTVTIKKCDGIHCVSSPFGSKEFLNSMSEGIVSASLKGSTLFLSDCSTAPGSEGGPVYLKADLDLPIGIVISSFNWWRRDWVGFTLIADIRPLICQLVGFDGMQINGYQSLNQKLATFDRCLAQVNCGANWGTCILISKENGLFLTNAHVVTQGLRIRLFWQNQLATARLIYKTPDDNVYDLAVLRCDDCWPSMSPADLRTIPYEVGDSVYCAGFPLLSTSTRLDSATVTHGIVSATNPYMIKTVCGVYPGFSGGGVFNPDGVLLGIIVCNIRVGDENVTYPKYNMAIPFKAVSDIISKFLENADRSVLSQLRTSNGNAQAIWKKLEAKL